MARLLSDESAQYLYVASAPITVEPCSAAYWVLQDEASDQVAFMINVSGNSYYYASWVQSDGDVTVSTRDAVENLNTVATASAALNTWNHVTCVWASSSSHSVYLNGGNKGSDSTTVTPGAVDETWVGRYYASGGFNLSGRIAGLVLWDIALTDSEAALMGRMGVPPWLIRPSRIVANWPFRQGHTWDRDVSGRGHHLTPYAAPTWAPDPPQVQLAHRIKDYRKWWRFAKGAPPALEIAITPANSAYYKAGPAIVGS